jgi:hypothetical protein
VRNLCVPGVQGLVIPSPFVAGDLSFHSRAEHLAMVPWPWPVRPRRHPGDTRPCWPGDHHQRPFVLSHQARLLWICFFRFNRQRCDFAQRVRYLWVRMAQLLVSRWLTERFIVPRLPAPAQPRLKELLGSPQCAPPPDPEPPSPVSVDFLAFPQGRVRVEHSGGPGPGRTFGVGHLFRRYVPSANAGRGEWVEVRDLR